MAIRIRFQELSHLFQVYWNNIYNFSLGQSTASPLILAAYFGHREVASKLLYNNLTGFDRFKSLFLKMEDDLINASDTDKLSDSCSSKEISMSITKIAKNVTESGRVQEAH